MSASIISLVEKYELTKALYEFRSQDGLTFADYGMMLQLSKPTGKNPGTQQRTFKLQKATLDTVTLWELFIQARRDFCELFSDQQLRLQLEDVVLLQAMSAKNLFIRNLRPQFKLDDWTSRMTCGNFAITTQLRELAVALYMPPDKRFVNFFAKEANTKSRQDRGVDFNKLSAYMVSKPVIGKKLFGYLEKGFRDNYIPEIDARFYKKWGTQTGSGEDGEYLRWLKEFGLSDDIINCHNDPGEVYNYLGHNIKNGLWPGEPVLHILKRDLIQAHS